MIIRSQDKKTIINLDNIDTISIELNPCGCDIVCFNGPEESKIGAYSSEEKAIKVLDDICAFANGLHFETIAIDQCGRLDGIVFQMPDNEKVEV